MTSAPNRLRQLNGNNVLIFLGIFLLVSACAGTRQSSRSQADSVPQGPTVYNPRTGQYEPVNDRNLVDTVGWSTDHGATPPITSVVTKTARFKDIYEVGVLVPFEAGRIDFSSESLNPKTSRFLNYYCGMKLAFHELEAEGVRLNVRIVDTRESPAAVEEQLQILKDADVIVGPYDKESLKAAARFADKNKIPVISPWTPSITLDSPSEYFVQITPGLSTHAAATMSYISRIYEDAEVFIVGLDGGSTRSRTEVYRNAYKNVFNSTERVHELNLPSGEFNFPELDILSMLYEDRPNIFVMPFYLQNEQEFINAVLRKLHAEKGEKEVYVFGLPQWLFFSSVNPDYLESLNAYISTVQYVDFADPEVRLFAQDFFNRYAAIPEPAAWQGYELTMFIGRSLRNFGTGFLDEITVSSISEPVSVRPVFAGNGKPESSNRILYFENQNIDILKFMDYTFKKVN